MVKKHPDTALLFFTHTAKEEAFKKNFKPGDFKKENRLIAGEFIKYTLRKARNSALPLYIVDDREQQGLCFGEKLANAFEKVFEDGFKNVIAFGNDCPSLQQQDFENTASYLNEHDVVLGPAKDGGTYLIGLSKEAFYKKDFINLSWRSPDLLKDFDDYLKKYGLKKLNLSAKRDVDNPFDFERIISELGGRNSLYKRLKSIIVAFVNNNPFNQKDINKETFLGSKPLRGPPFY